MTEFVSNEVLRAGFEQIASDPYVQHKSFSLHTGGAFNYRGSYADMMKLLENIYRAMDGAQKNVVDRENKGRP